MPVRLGNDSIEIINPDKTYVVDTIKSTGERDGDTVINVPVISPEYYTAERMYPPTRNLTSASHTISGQTYGDGVYETWESTVYTSEGNVHYGYSAFNTSLNIGYHALPGKYNGAVYNSTDYIVSDYKGDWIKIKLPVKINLSRYGMKQRPSNSARAPAQYKIYGSNDGDDWTVLVHKTSNITYSGLDFYENITTTGEYQYFAFVCNRLLGYNVLNFDEWYIYGKEKLLVEPQPIPGTTDYKTLTFTYDETRYPEIDADATNLIAHYKFDGNFNDSSGNGNDLIARTGTPTTSTTQYKIGSSAYFTSDSLKTTDYTFNNKAFSVAFWCYATEPGHIITQTQASSPNQNLHIQIQSNYKYRFGFYYNDLDSAVYDDRNQWVHLVFQIDASKNREIWRNGVRIANDTSSSFLNTGNNEVIIGEWKSTNDFFGSYLDDFRIYDKALTATEITDLYNQYYQTPYTLTFDNPTECDILIVGGGGAGGGNGQGGGGGAGTVIYFEDLQLTSGQYTIKVGKGGQDGFRANAGSNGNDTEFQKNNGTKKFLAKGGGGGGTWNANGYLPKVGGSGGGGAGNSNGGGITTGNIVNDVNVNIISNTYNNTGYTGDRGINSLNDTGCFGNIGGNEPAGGDDDWGAGGGGAGSSGAPTIQGSNDIAGDGGSGKKYDISGIEQFYGGGGGGGMRPSTDFSNGRPGNGGNGGGGNGGGEPSGTGGSGSDAVNGTGGGGGGVGATDTSNTKGGNGGSGIVIIRYKQKYNQVPFNAQWTYSAADTSVHHYGNVGIGIIASDTKKLTVRGDVNVIGDYYKNDILLTEQWKTSSQNTNNIYREKGFVGIGTDNVDYGIHVIGQLYAGSGGITGNGSTAWTSTSDSRVKQNIVPASGQKCVENVRNINLYRFNYNSSLIDTDDKHQLGFIAQEVQQYYPKAVKTNNLVLKNNMKIDNLLSVDVTQINYTLYGTVKKLAEDINTIREKLGITEIQTDVKNLAYVRKDGDGLKIS